jgi:methylthioribose-1-phosphate isomerase
VTAPLRWEDGCLPILDQTLLPGRETWIRCERPGAVAEVWVGETRPLNQGARLTAWELDRVGIPFRVVTDSSAGLLMSRGYAFEMTPDVVTALVTEEGIGHA